MRLLPVLACCLVVLSPTAALAADAPPPQPMTVGTALAPGNSGFVSVAGQAQGMASGDPGQYGANVDDQREMFWDGNYKDGRFKAPTGTPETPHDGVRLYTDAKGVKQVYGDSGFDVWYGAGYAAGQQRLFLADAVRRMGRGTFAELVGPSGVPVDVQTRTLTYSQADYDAMFAVLPASSKQAIEGYSAGLDAWISHVRTTPTDLPAEYALLSTEPAPWTVTDTLASGVLITRSVASAGGNEFDSVAALRELGGLSGLGAYTDTHWQDDRRAAVTVPPAEGTFDNAVVPAADRDAVLRRSAAYALALPKELASGPGTGAFPEPSTPTGVGVPPEVGGLLPSGAPLPARVRSSLLRAADALVAWGKGLHGGSYSFAVSPKRTSTGAAMLVSGPQLGYSYPNELYEIEVHGGGYDARGSTVPGLPTVGIGYGKRVAWGLTTGNSKTIDSFIETTRRVDGALEYRHDGAWVKADCRTETIHYRAAAMGVPVGPAALTVDVPVCRTVHGPIVATSGDLARSVQYAMYHRELETVTGILGWNRADDLAQFEAAMRLVTWNENTVYADADGHIAYWHPGLFPVRSPQWDSRFPAPGTGEYDTRGLVPFDRMPHAVDPAVGYLATWNNKPAAGWLDDFLDPASSRPGGKANRVGLIQSLLAAQPAMTPEALRATEYRLGTVDQRTVDFLPLVKDLTGASPAQQQALSLLRAWDGTSYGPGAGTSKGAYTDETVTDGPAPTIFRHYMDDLRDVVLADLPRDLVLADDAVGSHVFDASVDDNLVLRALSPSSSSLTPSRDYLRGRTPDQVMLAALDRSIAGLTTTYGADSARWRDLHPRRAIDSLTGVIGPSLTMPFMDRGSWVHVVAFTQGVVAAPGQTPSAAATPAAAAPAGTVAVSSPSAPASAASTVSAPASTASPAAPAAGGPAQAVSSGGLPRTGLSYAPALVGLLLLATAAAARRRRAAQRP